MPRPSGTTGIPPNQSSCYTSGDMAEIAAEKTAKFAVYVNALAEEAVAAQDLEDATNARIQAADEYAAKVYEEFVGNQNLCP